MIELLVGAISSGKSTWANQKANEGWIIINDDDVVNAVHGGNYLLYNDKLKPLYKSIENHILHIAIAMGKDVVIDRGLSLSKKARARWIALAKTLDTSIVARTFELFTPEIHAQRRVEAGGRGHNYEYWLKVAQRHMIAYSPPTLEEGFDIIIHQKWEPQCPNV